MVVTVMNIIEKVKKRASVQMMESLNRLSFDRRRPPASLDRGESGRTKHNGLRPSGWLPARNFTNGFSNTSKKWCFELKTNWVLKMLLEGFYFPRALELNALFLLCPDP